MSKKSNKPTGPTIARNGLAFTASWKIGGADYKDGQQFRRRLGVNSSWGSWTYMAIKPTTTSFLFANLSAGSYWPYTRSKLTHIAFQARGNTKKTSKKNPTWSDWAGASWKLMPPPAPYGSVEFLAYNQSKFNWKVDISNSDKQPFARVYWQSQLVQECLETEGWRLTWKNNYQAGTGSNDSNVVITEDSSVLANGSYTRWFRVMSQGCAGDNGWTYLKHVYAKPFTPVIESSSSSESSGVTTIDVKWVANSDAAHPIDETEIEYAMGTPATGLIIPHGLTPTEILSSIDTSGADAWHGEVSEILDDDECLWVRVAAKHDTNISYSAWKLTKAGKLKTPSSLTASFGQRVVVSASNNSTVPDSHLAVIYRSSTTEPIIIGIIEHGQGGVTVPYPQDGASEATIGVYAFQGTYKRTTRADGVYAYAVTANMTSDEVWLSNTLPAAPTDVMAVQSDTQGEVILSWDWAWTEADVAELSWSQNPNAWESTEEPESYILDNSHAAKWRISDLDTGVTWYFRVRLAIKNADDDYTFGPYSTAVAVDLSSAPAIPVLVLSESVITDHGNVTASWAYATTDGTAQAYAEVCEATISGGTITYGNVIARVQGAQRVTISAQDAGWNTGEIHSLCVRVVSASGKSSDGWSDPVSVTIADAVECTITSTSLENVTLEDDDGNTRTVLSLTSMPLSITVTGAGSAGTTRYMVIRAADYTMERPDESRLFSYEGEMIVNIVQNGETAVTINREDLIGPFDDGAQYRIIATVQDGLGQSAEDSIDFEVHWSHQAVMPSGKAFADESNLLMRITPVKPTGWTSGDTCDIYRLSVDRPELIVEGGEFGTEYIDPYPAFGETGGHRIVYRTADGDYITEDNTLAWVDLQSDRGDYIPCDRTVIDFDGNRVELEYNMTTSHAWKKEFTETSYLGGAIQGDWNPGIHRSSKVNAVMSLPDDADTIEGMRRLATYSGICHIRTADGSSFAADVQVTEDRGYSTAGKIISFSLTVTRVDPEELDGLPYSEWVVNNNGLV